MKKNIPNGLIVVYKLGQRFNGELSPKESINLYKLHAKEHDGKVLFTIDKAPAAQFRDRIEKIILMTKDGSSAILADVPYLGKGNIIQPPKDFTPLSLWDNEDISNKGWFALENIQPIVIGEGDYTTVNETDLLQSMKGNAYMTYIEIPDSQKSN